MKKYKPKLKSTGYSNKAVIGNVKLQRLSINNC